MALFKSNSCLSLLNGFIHILWIKYVGMVLWCQFSGGILKCHFLLEFPRWEVSNPSIWLVCLWSPDLNLKPSAHQCSGFWIFLYKQYFNKICFKNVTLEVCPWSTDLNRKPSIQTNPRDLQKIALFRKFFYIQDFDTEDNIFVPSSQSSLAVKFPEEWIVKWLADQT